MKLASFDIFDTTLIRKCGRVAYIDTLRGLAMLAVVCGHCGLAEKFVYVFQVPLFIFVSGLLAHAPSNNRRELGEQLKRHVVRLYLPFVLLQLTAFLLHNVFYSIGWYRAYFDVSINSVLTHIFKIVTMGAENNFWEPYGS